MGPPPLCRGDCPDLPPGGKVSRPKAVTDEGASVCSVLGGHTGPPLQAGTGRTFCRGGPVWPPAGRWGRFPLSGGNVERSETKGVGTIGPYGWCNPVGRGLPDAPFVARPTWPPIFLQIKQLAKAIKRNRTACKFYTIEPQNKSGDVVWKAKRKRTR